ncbi:MAG: hypothetical protein A2270_09650 [Elusimicrobia bacterium RIFOXYA12_FULL_51_18]|nr:MAG: hypothetical protein A2270_09650 [Elusimicrobia bacterium RIFOXYA12_FULL_51_18]OGS32766.1 MAG: hypothetical protein A2218_11965 [Elusimicrobia bacterium RIFOXYA2_FULL_53_38]
MPSKTFLQTKTLSPSYIAVDLTYRCALNCPFCFVKRNGLSDECGCELGLAGWLKIIRALGPGGKKFYLTGGEPLLLPFLPALVRELKTAGHSVLVTTAARVSSEAAAELAAAGPDEIALSVHGPRAAHDRIAGAGTWSATIPNLEIMKARRPAGTRITLWCTVNQGNHARLPETWRALASLGADGVAFNHLEFVSASDTGATAKLLSGIGLRTPLKASADLLRGIDAAKLAAGVAAVQRKAGPAVKFYPPLTGAEIKAWYSPGTAFKKKGFCLGQFRATWFAPDGRLLTCQPLAVHAGAGLPSPLAAYNGPAYSAFRILLLKQGGFLPACRRCGRAPYHTLENKGV